MALEFYEILCIGMFAAFIVLLFSGFPVAWVLGGVALVTVTVAAYIFPERLADGFYSVAFSDLAAVTSRIWTIMQNWVLVALPMFVFMGLMLDRSGIAAELMENFVKVLGRAPGGLAVTVAAIGLLLAASTGIIGASVVLLALLGMPIMLRTGYSPSFAAGTVSAVGTLGILIPPSIMLVLMADRTPGVDAGGLFMGALIPGAMLGVIYIGYMMAVGLFSPKHAPLPPDARRMRLSDLGGVFKAVLPPAALILAVLGSIFAGFATPTEAAGVGACGATLLALMHKKLDRAVLREVCEQTTKTTAFIFAIFVGATAFSFVFQALGGEEFIHHGLKSLPFSHDGILISVLFLVFVLGFFLDWIEITLIVLPLVAPVIAGLDVGPAEVGPRMIWFVVLVAVCLQTSFLTPPVGFALFYLKGVAPKEVTVAHIYKGVIPFILLQLGGLVLVYVFPALATWLPKVAYGS
ncbi:TRAP transporter large permease subunit [Nitrogeniibacter mangrovi]|uniref:TRAP transporter large permease subunit n=1 Tax=Nitrogeniibacter mangrovi TaxID=2016596 RepID=A0A6C1B8N5_9RHOO|nr:TRAP transporter large permease subunit [Nitrogeniibacter mangrovi]QID19195.1 TRAP transporter large permease subunit [Nitrogeniibacter mangrovi]